MSVLILGATSRIAHELAHRYAENGQSVYVAARDAEIERLRHEQRAQVRLLKDKFRAISAEVGRLRAAPESQPTA